MPPKEPANEGEIWASRFNVGLARSQRVISSWLSEAPNLSASTPDSDEEDFKNNADERAPLGAKPKDADLPESVRRSRMSNDKLLEQIIGKKAAQAKRKAQLESKQGAPKVVVKPVEESEEEEGEGRAAVFASRKKGQKMTHLKTPANAANSEVAEVQAADEDARPPDPREDLATVKSDSAEEEDERPKKRKANSYLDELLAKKAKKSKKKKKKVATTT